VLRELDQVGIASRHVGGGFPLPYLYGPDVPTVDEAAAGLPAR